MLSAALVPLYPFAQRASLLGAAILAGSASAVAADVKAGPAPDARDARDLVVFVGLELMVEVSGEPCPVVGGNERELEVRTRHGIRTLPVAGSSFVTKMEPKMSGSRVQIDGVRSERAYSPATDPYRRAMHQQMVMEAVQAQAQESAEMEMRASAQTAERIAREAAQPNSTVSQSAVAAAQQEAFEASQQFNNAMAAPQFRSALPGHVHDQEAYDVFELTFRLSTPETYERALGVLRLLVRDPAKPNLPAQTIKFFELRRLGPKPRKLRWEQTGLPPGFSVDSYSVHVYANGREIPTNLSQNRVEISADEAHQFLVLQHAHANSRASMPAQVALDLRPAGLESLVQPDQRQATVELGIDRDGRITNLQPSAAFPDVLTLELDAALREVRFLPALLNGQPVASRGTFALGELLP